MRFSRVRDLLLLFHLLCITSSENGTEAANILFYSPMTSFSHRIAIWPLADKLAENGHNVTIFATSSPKKYHPESKVSEFAPQSLFIIDQAPDDFDGIAMRIEGVHESGIWQDTIPYCYSLCEAILRSEETIDWVKRSHFDLVFIDSSVNDCGVGLAYKFKAPIIYFGAASLLMWQYDILGISSESSWIPDMQYHYQVPMGFWERLQNAIHPISWYFTFKWVILPQMEVLMRETLEIPEMPSLLEIERGAKLLLSNSHFSEEFARSLPPFVIPVGGLHIQEKRQPLPNVFQEIFHSYLNHDV